jgi:HAD domain in Swiss Army Knife RNA repair proteins
MSKKACFFDVNGVLSLDGDIYELDKFALSQLKRIVKETGSVLVLTSSWRKWADAREMIIAQLRRIGLSVYGWTKVTGASRQTRCYSILDYLNENKEITRYAIVDDRSDARIPGEPESFFLTTYIDGGLTKTVADCLCQSTIYICRQKE